MIWMYAFAGLLALCAFIFGMIIDANNTDGKYQSSIPIFIIMFLFSIVTGGIVSKSTNDIKYDQGYQKGQIDYQKGKIEYKVEIKQVSDTTITKVN